MKQISITAIVLLLAAAAMAQTAITDNGTLLICESKNNSRHTCRADLRGKMVTLNRQLSGNDCVRGRTWGTTRNRKGIWVDDGCRGEFLISEGTRARAFGPTVLCESLNNRIEHCRADTTYGAQLARQISKNNCIRGEDWGFDQKGIWVKNGCRAEFTLGTALVPMASSGGTILTCESANNRLQRCAANTSFGVTLSRQLSDNACVRSHTWGFDSEGVWVSKGCRAEFLVGPNR